MFFENRIDPRAQLVRRYSDLHYVEIRNFTRPNAARTHYALARVFDILSQTHTYTRTYVCKCTGARLFRIVFGEQVIGCRARDLRYF